MSKFIWVLDADKREHYLNVDTIVRVTKLPASTGVLKSPEYSYIHTLDGNDIRLTNDEKTYDTFQHIVEKIQSR